MNNPQENVDRNGVGPQTNIYPQENSIRGELEKIAWKHYDPESSINVEEMLDEMIPVITASMTGLLDRVRKEINGLAKNTNRKYREDGGIKYSKEHSYNQALKDTLSLLSLEKKGLEDNKE